VCRVGDGSAAAAAAAAVAAAGEGPPLIEQLEDQFLRDALVDNRNRMTGAKSPSTQPHPPSTLWVRYDTGSVRSVVHCAGCSADLSRVDTPPRLHHPTHHSPVHLVAPISVSVVTRLCGPPFFAVLKVELEMEKFLKGAAEQLRFTMQLTSYQRAAIHRVASFYQMQSEKVVLDDDPLAPGHILIRKTQRTKAPLVCVRRSASSFPHRATNPSGA
jgi:hypothetical protein